jgi:HD-GYP domain-containing protein (c-di-GMP phosphodiesterase class II)
MPPERPFLPHDHFPTLPPDADQESVAREQKARAICQMGNHRAILESFREPENHLLLEEHKKSLQSDPHILDKLSDILPSLTAAHWEMLALLDLFDPATFDHCVRTYQIIERKLKSAHPVGAFLETELKREGVTRETLAISALLHDVGKIGIPLKDLILNNSASPISEWHHLCSRILLRARPLRD